MSVEGRGPLYRTAGEVDGPISGQICSKGGVSGNDDPEGLGRVAFFPYNWPNTISQDNALWAQVLTQSPQGPCGRTVHHCLIDGLRVACSMMPDGTPLIHTIWASLTGGDKPGTGGAEGENTYVGCPTRKG